MFLFSFCFSSSLSTRGPPGFRVLWGAPLETLINYYIHINVESPLRSLLFSFSLYFGAVGYSGGALGAPGGPRNVR